MRFCRFRHDCERQYLFTPTGSHTQANVAANSAWRRLKAMLRFEICFAETRNAADVRPALSELASCRCQPAVCRPRGPNLSQTWHGSGFENIRICEQRQRRPQNPPPKFPPRCRVATHAGGVKEKGLGFTTRQSFSKGLAIVRQFVQSFERQRAPAG